MPLANSMQLYFVRHGETGGNIAARHQSDNTDLTQKGLLQATEAAQILREKNPTHLVSSTMLRALETARIIGLACDLIPETDAIFTEVGRPARLNGHLLKSVYSLWFYMRWYFGLTSMITEGGETYKMFRERLHASRKHLATYPNDARVIVVSHSVFINFFVMHMCDDRPIGPIRAALCFWRILTIKNGSITSIHLDTTLSDNTCRFKLEK